MGRSCASHRRLLVSDVSHALLLSSLGKPPVWSPHGSLQRWDEITRVVEKYMGGGVLPSGAQAEAILHTTSEDEASQSRERFPGVRVVIIRNGMELPADVRKCDSGGSCK